MGSYKRNVITLGIFAHADAGKTTVTEQLLYHTGIINSVGRVDNGNTVTDSLSIEKRRGITIKGSLVSFSLVNKVVQLIDTPGHIDFSAEVERAISVLDCAILVVSGVESIEAQTYTIWRELKKKNIPVIIFINKMDRRGADFQHTIRELNSKLGINTLSLNKVINDLQNILKTESTSIEQVIEELSLVDDLVLEKYVLNKKMNRNDIFYRAKSLFVSGNLTPVICGSALMGIGVKDLIECLKYFLPDNNLSDDDSFSAFVYTVQVSENGKKIFAKIVSGELELRNKVKSGENLFDIVNKMFLIDGAKEVSVKHASCGDIVIIYGLDIKCGQFIGKQSGGKTEESFVKPLLTVGIKPNERKHSFKLMSALQILNEEDPYLNVRFNKINNSIYIDLMGDVQKQIIASMLEERFNIKADFSDMTIIHKETPTINAKSKVSYTSVSSVELEITPLKRGEGFVYCSKISTDFLHIRFQRQVERLINQYRYQGLFGWELTDMEVALTDGQFDSMGSDPVHFNIITPIALFRCLKKSKIKLLEPVFKYIISFPEENLNLVVKSLSMNENAYKITNHINGIVTIEGEVALSYLLNYPLVLSKITSGRGVFSSAFSYYDFSINQEDKNDFFAADPRNETTFIINEMKSSIEPLDVALMKKKKESRSKFARIQKEKQNGGNRN